MFQRHTDLFVPSKRVDKYKFNLSATCATRSNFPGVQPAPYKLLATVYRTPEALSVPLLARTSKFSLRRLAADSLLSSASLSILLVTFRCLAAFYTTGNDACHFFITTCNLEIWAYSFSAVILRNLLIEATMCFPPMLSFVTRRRAYICFSVTCIHSDLDLIVSCTLCSFSWNVLFTTLNCTDGTSSAWRKTAHKKPNTFQDPHAPFIMTTGKNNLLVILQVAGENVTL